MSRPRAWLLMLALLASSCSQAELRLQLHDEGLSSGEQQASQQLLQEALQALPPQFRQQLDRRVSVRWGELPAEVYGRAGRFSGIELNAALLPALSDGSSATQQTSRPHGSVRRELLATLLHELTHLYDRAQLWPQAERQLQQGIAQHHRAEHAQPEHPNCAGGCTIGIEVADD